MTPLTQALTKRLSTSGTAPSRPDRRSLSSNTANVNKGRREGDSSPTSWATDTRHDTADVQNSSSNLLDITQEQEARILTLESELASLRRQLRARPTEEELEDMRKEWQTSEDLFSQSQKDNEQKHGTIEMMRQYVKALETKLEDTLGADWRDCCDFAPPPANSTITSRTPLPKPAAAPRSASLQRSSRTSRGISASDIARLRELGVSTTTAAADKTTPSSALRKLEGKLDGIRESNADSGLEFSTSTASTVDCASVEMLVSSLPTAVSPRVASGPSGAGVSGLPRSSAAMTDLNSPPISPAFTSPSFPGSHQGAAQAQLLEQVAALMGMVKALPGTVNKLQDNDRAEERERIETQKAAMLDMLDAAEMRADAREMRLQALLAEAKTCSGQMGW